MSDTERPSPKRPCPICKSPVQTSDFRPFCSSRCRDKDLNRWFSDSYALPGKPADPEDIARELDRGQDPRQSRGQD